MRLEIGNFYVREAVFGDRTAFENGVLTINKQEALAFVMEDEHITKADIEITKPGDSVRIVPVKEAIEPRCRVDREGPVFPGVTGEVAAVGNGVTHALKGCSVLAVGMEMGSFGDGVIDMSGDGAKYTLFSQMINICLVADTDEDFERNEQQKKNHAVRWGAHRLAEYLGNAVRELQPEEREVFELPPVTKRSPEVMALPSVVYVMQVQSQMEEMGYNDLVLLE